MPKDKKITFDSESYSKHLDSHPEFAKRLAEHAEERQEVIRSVMELAVLLAKQQNSLATSVPFQHLPEYNALKKQIQTMDRITIEALLVVHEGPELDRALPVKNLSDTTRASLMRLVAFEKEKDEREKEYADRAAEKEAGIAERKQSQHDERWLNAGISALVVVTATLLIEVFKS